MPSSSLLKKSRCNMNREVIEKAENIINERKRKNEEPYTLILEQFSKDEEFSNLRKKYQQEIIENAKKEAYGEKTNKTLQEKLKKEIDEYFSKNGVKNTISHSCKKCQDNGYINGKMCECLKKEISNILFEESNFGKLVSFSEAEKGAQGTLKMLYKKMKEWCHSDFKKNIIFLSGQVGTGKTFLTRAMANELIEQGKIVKLVTAFQMSRDFKEYRSTYNEAILDKYLSCEFLFIDDLGTEVIYKNSTIEFLYQVLNERQMRKLCTIITSNLDLAEIRDRYDERIFSRIANRETSISVILKNEDLRLK